MDSWRWPHIKRDMVLFVLGVGGIFHEAFIRSGDTRPEWIVAFLTLCGVPSFLHRDEIKGQGGEDTDDTQTTGAG